MKKLLFSLGLLSSLSMLQVWSADSSAAAAAHGSIDISGLDKIEVFRALYAKASPQGRGFIKYAPGDLTYDDARRILEAHRLCSECYNFDYVKGRSMKIGFDGDRIPATWLFNRGNGVGAAESVIAKLRTERK